MGATEIEYVDETRNFLRGCQRVSKGCDRCYAIRTSNLRAKNPHPAVAARFAGLVERTPAGALDWTGNVNVDQGDLAELLRGSTGKRIFINSLSDVFYAPVPDEVIALAFAVMALARQHTFLLLTKRHGRMKSLLNSGAFANLVWQKFRGLPDWLDGLELDPEIRIPAAHWDAAEAHLSARERSDDPMPALPNLWLGVSAEDQQTAALRIPALMDTPAAVRWVSAEPLLGPLDLRMWLNPACLCPDSYRANGTAVDHCPDHGTDPRVLDWVVAGGETGPGARSLHPGWLRSIRDQIAQSSVEGRRRPRFFFKQWGDFAPLPGMTPDGLYRDMPFYTVADDGTVYEPGSLAYPDGPRRGDAIRAGHDHACLTAMYRVGKTTAGRELDGRTHDDLPIGRTTR